MKSRTYALMKKVLSALVTVLKAKSMAVKSRANEVKTRLIIFWLLRNKNFLMSTISHKIHALISREKVGASCSENCNKAIVPHDITKTEALPNPTNIELEEKGEEDYLEMGHLIFDSEDEEDGLHDDRLSVIDSVGNSREDGSDISLEDEIDHMADEFISRFHKQMRMEKQDSVKRYREMLERSA